MGEEPAVVERGSGMEVSPGVFISNIHTQERDAAAHEPGHVTWEVREDLLGRERSVEIDHGGIRGGDGNPEVKIEDRYGGEVRVRWDRPGIASASGGVSFELSWPEATVRTASRGALRSDETTWYLELELEVSENGGVIRTRRWERTLPRDLQ